ncbi:MAG: polymerase factor sigma-54 [Bacteroidota bacterium]|jgi:RNA polymerase sigma-54 factor
MQKLGLSFNLSQKLSPQQIQFIKLLQIPTAELEARIEEELEINPALEEGEFTEGPADEVDNNDDNFDEEYDNSSENDDYEDSKEDSYDEEIPLTDYLDEDYAGYKMQGDGNGNDEEDRDIPFTSDVTLSELLQNQLGFLKLSERETIIGEQLIGTIDNDGYIRRDLEAIANDLAFQQSFETDIDEIESVLFKIQTFEPAGVGARNLQECLLLQLKRRHDHQELLDIAIDIIEHSFEEFTKKHYEKIQKKYNIDDEQFKEVIDIITHLNPKPGGSEGGDVKSQYIIPDYILTNNNGKLELSLNSKNAPDLKISRAYMEMFETYDKSDKKDKKMREAVTFVKHKLDSAKWFIDAIYQRQLTLLRTMEAILKMQYDFFLEGDETKLKPMILKDIATVIDMDISTVSRVASSKTILTEFGLYPLKYFFSEGITTDSGEDVSSREVKQLIKEIIDKEEKQKPLSDDKLDEILREKGYNIARRTVAKYREQMGIPVARLRKEV